MQKIEPFVNNYILIYMLTRHMFVFSDARPVLNRLLILADK